MSAPSDGVVHRQHQLDNGLLISAEIDPKLSRQRADFCRYRCS